MIDDIRITGKEMLSTLVVVVAGMFLLVGAFGVFFASVDLMKTLYRWGTAMLEGGVLIYILAYYLLTRFLVVLALLAWVLCRVYRGSWHIDDTNRPDWWCAKKWIFLNAVSFSIPFVGECAAAALVAAVLLKEMDTISQRREIQIRAEASRQRPEAGQVSIVDQTQESRATRLTDA